MSRFAKILSLVLLMASPASAQGTQVAFGGVAESRDEPVEVTADQLTVDEADGTAIFTGDVVIGQGDMRLSAPRVLVVYTEDQTAIERLEATGGVTLVSGEDAAEADRADYNIDDGMILLTGSVLVTQGTSSSLTGDRMTVDLDAGTAQVQGRVRTVLQPAGDQ